MLPQHDALVSVQDSSRLHKLGSTLMHLARSGNAGTWLMLGLFICLAIVFFNMFSSDESPPSARYDNDSIGTSSWDEAYSHSNAKGARRDAMDLLFKSGIINEHEKAQAYVAPEMIEECIQAANKMLKEKHMDYWMKYNEEAHEVFNEHTFDPQKGTFLHSSGVPSTPSFEPAQYESDFMKQFDRCDGSWAQAYVKSKGNQERQEAFQLLLRLDIISKGQFADSLVSPSYIEAHVKVAVGLLKQRSFNEWISVYQSAHGEEFKRSVIAQFQAGDAAPSAAPPMATIPPGADPFNTTKHVTHVPNDGVQTIDTRPYPSNDASGGASSPFTTTQAVTSIPAEQHWKRGGSTSYGTSSISDLVDGPQTIPVEKSWRRGGSVSYGTSSIQDIGDGVTPAGTAHYRGEDQMSHRHSVHWTDKGEEPQAPPPAYSSGRAPAAYASGQQAAAHVLPVNSMPEPSTLPPTAVPQLNVRMADSERPRSLNWASGGSMNSMNSGRTASPRMGSASQGVPVQIRFANNAVSGSSWEANVTPPGSQRSMPTSHRSMPSSQR
jgi:hypothetical protein